MPLADILLKINVMPSLSAAMSEWDKLKSQHDSWSHSYRSAVRAIDKYAVEIDSESVRNHHLKLALILQQVGEAREANQILDTSSALVEELKVYKENSKKSLQRMQTELRTTADALQTMIESFSRSDSDQEERLKNRLTNMRKLACLPTVQKVCPSLANAMKDLESSVEGVLKGNRLVVAQLRDEIHTLHRSLDRVANTTNKLSASGTHERKALEHAIKDSLEIQRPLAAILILLNNSPHLEAELSSEGHDALLLDFYGRLSTSAAVGSQVGLWSDNVFMQIVSVPSAEAINVARAWAASIPKPFMFDKDGKSVSLRLRFRTAVICSRQNTTQDEFISACDTTCETRALRTSTSGLKVDIQIIN